MNTIMKRLKSKAGETLVESMAAILIFTFGSIIMLSMVTSAADINTAAREADREYFEDMVIIELAQENSNSTVAFTVKDASGLTTISVETVTVSVSGDTTGLYAYYKKLPTAQGGTG